MRSQGKAAFAKSGMRARSSIWPRAPYEKYFSRRPIPSGLITAKRPTAGSRSKKAAFESPFAPRPCGEITTGSGGLLPGPYQAGSTT